MYLEHFGLNEPPFRITPHTDFFFDGANRGATLDALIYAVTHDEGIVKVSGEVGSGKTMLCRVLMERLPETVTIIYLANPSLSRDDILYTIADELRLDIPENARSSAVLRALQDHLIKSFGEGRQVVVLIDEAHAMPVETLEEIRLLSNLETNRSKLLQLVLFGQPELNDILARPDMRQLKERITHNFGLEPLVRDDIDHYLDFRMRAAGYRGPSVFSPTALKMIEQNSLGLTRRINILADKALLAAFSLGSHQIGAKEIQAAIRDCEFSKATYGSKTARKTRTAWIAASLAVCVLAGFVWLMTMPRSDNGAPATAVGEPPVPTPAIGTASAAVTAPPPSPATRTKAAIASPSSPSAKQLVGPLTLERLEAGRTWLGQLPDDRWFIQVYATNADQHGKIETLLNSLSSSKTEMSNIHVYYSELSGKPRYGVMYGEYSTSEATSTAIRELPKALRAGNPYPRQVVRLR